MEKDIWLVKKDIPSKTLWICGRKNSIRHTEEVIDKWWNREHVLDRRLEINSLVIEYDMMRVKTTKGRERFVCTNMIVIVQN
ncbi:hypothetical protein GWI33_014299 [Rhynchophorus ferrugineus]|uniref:Uncharacterized protein n=1 Tax=Rhynchophorus ferrugineus TaxID=354439 RepID=A0A834I7M4_RHYFE|nr:hypothetical protein GWI33_014299 [Rhynchophorus ferrugineus]